VQHPAWVAQEGAPDHHLVGSPERTSAQMHDMPVSAEPSLAPYWHIGETPTLFLAVTPRRLSSWKSRPIAELRGANVARRARVAAGNDRRNAHRERDVAGNSF
jgi:hypothetical protein